MIPDWTGRTAVCIASGPGLTADDCEMVHASGHPSVVTNTTFRLCPWANILFGYDPQWWMQYIEEVKRVFTGQLFCNSPIVRGLGVEWAQQDLRFIPFNNSGACSISLAIAAGAQKIVMLGFDCQFTGGLSHHHGDHPPELSNCESLPSWPAQFGRLAKYVKAKGVSVVNASRVTALTCFDRPSLESCL